MAARRGLFAAACTGWLVACGAVDPPDHLRATRAVVDAAGAPIALSVAWQVDVGSARVLQEAVPQTGGIAVSAPGDRIYVTLADGALACFATVDGSRVWSTPLGGAATGAPALVDGTLLVGAPDGTLRAIDASSGSERWRVAAPGSFGSTPTVVDGVAYIVSSNSRLVAVDVLTGRARWTFDRPPARTIGMVGQSSVLVDEGLACAGFADGSLACVNNTDGTTRWVADLSRGARRLMDVDTTPLRAGNVLIAASFDGGLAGVSVIDGTEQWHHALRGATSALSLGDTVVSTTIDGLVLWLDPASGEVVRSLELDSRGLLPAVRHPSALLVGGASGGLYAIAHNAPWILNRFDPDSGISALPAVHGTTVYLLTDGGFLYRIDLAGT